MNMIENYSGSKRVKVDDRGGTDLLSDLPLGIIHMILALVPIRDAVRTSILSTQWRHTWTTLPQLVFYLEGASQQHKSASKYEEFITWVLFRHKGPIHTFSFSCTRNFQNVDEWIYCLSRNGIRELNFDWNHLEASCAVMKSSIYSCKELTYLSLYNCELDPPSLTFKGFLFLRRLCLNMVSLTPDEIRRLVALCPLLESFEIFQLGGSKLQISAPNLKYMHIMGDIGSICIDAPLMSEISLQSINYSFEEVKSSACDYVKCFGGFTNLQKLTASCELTKRLSFGIKPCHHLWSFCHLKLMDLNTVDFQDVKEIMVLAHLVIGSPNLQELKIESWYLDESDAKCVDLSFFDLGCAPNFKLEKLTDISLFHFTGLPLEAKFLNFLFKSSPVLETVIVDTAETGNNVRAILQGYYWASPPVVNIFFPSAVRRGRY